MHSFHQSRGRIYFEIFCALTIGASCAVAWLQTGASALLAIAAVTAVYSLVHATDAGAARREAVAAEAPNAWAVAEADRDPLADAASRDAQPTKAGKAKAAKPKRSRKKEAVSEPVAAMTAVEGPEPVIEIEAVEPVDQEQAHDEHHAPVTPLFEPQPLVRQQRAIFGRKAG